MKRIFAFFVCVPLHSLPAEDIRIAHFDAKRVFTAYQHTQDCAFEVQSHVYSGGSSSKNELFERYKQLLDSLKTRDTPRLGTPERESYDLHNKVIGLELRELEGQINRRKDDAQKKLESQKKEIYLEIWAAAKDLAKENGYLLVVPENLPEGHLASVIATAQGDDITDRLVVQLNREYARRKPK